MTAPALLLYRAASGLFAPFAPRFLALRARRGKEDSSRLSERLGRPRTPRPDGPFVATLPVGALRLFGIPVALSMLFHAAGAYCAPRGSSG